MAKKKEEEIKIPLRLNILFFIVFIMFAVLIIQLGIVQILHGQSFQEEIDRTIQDISKKPVPRGKIYDRNGKILVDNKPLYAISYTPPKRVQHDDKLELAEQLLPFLSVDESMIKRLTKRNKQEYIYLKNKEEIHGRLTDAEKEALNDVEQYKLALEKITDEEIEALTEEELKVIAIKRELDKAYALLRKSSKMTIFPSKNMSTSPNICPNSPESTRRPIGNRIYTRRYVEIHFRFDYDARTRDSGGRGRLLFDARLQPQ